MPRDDESVAVRVIAMPADTNPLGDIFGGWLMCQMDLAAGSVAARRAEGRAVTIASDSMTFLRPVKVGDEVSVFAKLDREGRSSMRINVEAWRRPRHSAAAEKVTEAAFTFVAVDEEGRPRLLPALRDADDAREEGERTGVNDEVSGANEHG